MELDPKLWLDNVRAVASVGIKFENSFETGPSLMAKLKPLLVKWQQVHKEVKANLLSDLKIKIERSDGVEIALSQDQVACKFYYVSTLVEKGHIQPVIEYQVGPQPFSHMIHLVEEALAEVVVELLKEGNRTIKLIGVVAEGSLDPGSLPPGFELFECHLKRPWKLGLVEGKTNLVARLAESDDWVDRCHHLFEIPPEDGVYKFKLDWQRVWSSVERPSSGKLKGLISIVSAEGCKYFGSFGLGELDYAASNNCE